VGQSLRLEKMPFPNDKKQMVLSRRESPMEPTQSKLPREAIELYNDFIHGEISRRAFIEGVQRLAGGMAIREWPRFSKPRPE